MVGCAYAATKAAALALVRQTAIELTQYDIRINAIAPCPFATDSGAAESTSNRSTTPSPADPRLNESDSRKKEIQGLALLLASPASSFINGATFVIDGGAT
jgi:NAD(P)-dependent dehydrogenase (short-subunit alcohol dehydrogenase family)